MDRAQCIIHRGNELLMMKAIHLQWGYEFWHLPGGGIYEKGETPEQAAIRELQEECRVHGTLVREINTYNPGAGHDTCYTFLVDIGNQEPLLGNDPQHETQTLIGVDWLMLSEISERDRAFLWASGLLGIDEFANELLSWGHDISYPKITPDNRKHRH